MKTVTDTLVVLIAAGGTGGHVFPALAVAERLRELGHRVSWLGVHQGLESRVVPENGFPITYVSISGVRGKGLVSWLFAPIKLLVAVWQSLRAIRATKTDVVLGMGGFVAGPAGIAGWIARRPLLIHEQNAVPGLTNRVLSRFAQEVMEAFPGSFAHAVNVHHTGNPVRASMVDLPPPEERLSQRAGALRVLVLGGSQGARVLNEVMPAALAALAKEEKIEVRHQAGARLLEQARSHYKQAGLHVEPVPFLEDMAEAYTWADLVLCRAGAMTVAELAAVGTASILVPFPYAVDDHQTVNAHYLADAGAAVLVEEREFTVPRLARLLDEFCGARERLVSMAKAARRLAMPGATDSVVRFCTGVAHG
jgi:UDP-N-acetylglucosamine--N-acetylmuramyl-(pentapeptide) pyrophosphoryl-undecaprenol N-acetylglucosamine transferase